MKIKKVNANSTCKICHAQAPLYGVIDFNDIHGRHNLNMPLSGYAIYYHRCPECGLIYTNAFDDWTEEDFATHVYNDDYIHIDPDFPQKRPQQNADFLIENFADLASWKMLDFGCGSNRLVNLLKERGITATGWDPFYPSGDMPTEKFDFIVNFEVMEHTPDPLKTVSLINDLLDERDGKCFFTTLNNNGREKQGMHDWYILPRGGHVTYYSRKALDILFNRFNMRVYHMSEGLHLAFRLP
jgi:SAM-dependent methyltransferase